MRSSQEPPRLKGRRTALDVVVYFLAIAAALVVVLITAALAGVFS